MYLAPLRGVTVRCFRTTFAAELREAGFSEAITPFISVCTGTNPLRDRELRGGPEPIRITPQLIGKDPVAFRDALVILRDAGYRTIDLNAGCPFPMVRNKGRGSGLLRTPNILREMLSVGCEVLGDGAFSLKTRLGIDSPNELLAIMPVINEFPLRFLTIHARTARQMYEGACDWEAFDRVAAIARMPVVRNGDLPPAPSNDGGETMVGRAFVRALGEREDSSELLLRYCESSLAELGGCDHATLGRLKELVAYWKDLPNWRRLWPILKLARTTKEFLP